MADTISWIATAATILAASMTAANLGSRITGYGFVVFTAGAICWIAVGAMTHQPALMWTNVVLTGLDLFGKAAEEVRSIALIRLAPHFPGDEKPRPGLCAFGSTEPEGFTAAMGCELIAFIARVVERTAERWPQPA